MLIVCNRLGNIKRLVREICFPQNSGEVGRHRVSFHESEVLCSEPMSQWGDRMTLWPEEPSEQRRGEEEEPPKQVEHAD